MDVRALSVLVIDDDPTIAPGVAMHLRRSGWVIIAAKDGKSGLALARQHVPDIVLCDADMPHLSGPQVIEIMKSDPATKNIPIILMTGLADADMFSGSPWTGFLEKPFATKDLSAAVSAALASRNPPQ